MGAWGDIGMGFGSVILGLVGLLITLVLFLFLTVPYFYTYQRNVDMEVYDWRKSWTTATYVMASAITALAGIIYAIRGLGSNRPALHGTIGVLTLIMSLAMFVPLAVCLWYNSCDSTMINWMRLITPLAVVASVGAIGTALNIVQ